MKFLRRTAILMVLFALILTGCAGDFIKAQMAQAKAEADHARAMADLAKAVTVQYGTQPLIEFGEVSCKEITPGLNNCSPTIKFYDPSRARDQAEMVAKVALATKPTELQDPVTGRIRATGDATAKFGNSGLGILGGGALLVSQARGNTTNMSDSQNDGGSRNKTRTDTSTTTHTSTATSTMGSHNPVTQPAPVAGP